MKEFSEAIAAVSPDKSVYVNRSPKFTITSDGQITATGSSENPKRRQKAKTDDEQKPKGNRRKQKR